MQEEWAVSAWGQREGQPPKLSWGLCWLKTHLAWAGLVSWQLMDNLKPTVLGENGLE